MQLTNPTETTLAPESTTTVSTTDSNSPSLTISADPEAKQILVTVMPPVRPRATSTNDGGKRAALDICCVIDVSGSMATEAPMPADPDSGAPAESAGLSVLDVVKHALRTIISTTQEDDRVALVSFSDKAEVVAGMTQMTEQGRTRVLQSIKGLQPDDSTNLWDGLKVGMDMFITQSEANTPPSPSGRVSTLFILTDGMPNIHPPRGHIPMLKAYLDAYDGPQPFSINTFGFGYHLDTNLLLEIAEVGGGAYAFIPDSGMVGTVFVNAVANTYATYAPRVSLDVEISPDYPFKVKGSLPVTPTSWGAKIQAGDLQYGQSLDFVLEFSDKFTTDISATLTYHAHNSPEPCKVHADSISKAPSDLATIRYHAARLKFVELVFSKPQSEDAIKALKALHKDIMDSPVLSKYADALALGTDVSGEGVLAYDSKHFKRWGRHYLPSLARSHQRQQCGNFKDPGLQVYGRDSQIFKEERDKLDAAFMSLPPPEPSRLNRDRVQLPAGMGGAQFKASAAAPAPKLKSMSRWNRSSGPCFAGDCLVKLSTGEDIKVEALKRGMEVRTMRGPNKVAAVVRTAITDGDTLLCRLGDLKVTPWHPIVSNGTWAFPATITPPELTACDAVYSILLAPGSWHDADAHSVSIAGIWCVTLGHGLTDRANLDVRSHVFLGDYERVLADLSRLEGFHEDDGRVRCIGTRRNAGDGMICGFVGEVQDYQETVVEEPFCNLVHV